jgi:hypothetical protein
MANQPSAREGDLSMTVGAALPMDAVGVAGPGTQPYLQFPWSAALGGGWGIGGMVSNLFIPDGPISKYSNQSTFVVQKSISNSSFRDFPLHGGIQSSSSTQAEAIASPTRSRSTFASASASTATRQLIFSAPATPSGSTACSGEAAASRPNCRTFLYKLDGAA